MKMKKSLAVVISAAMALSMCAGTAFAEEADSEGAPEAPTTVTFTINGVESEEYTWEYCPPAEDDPATDGVDETSVAYYKLSNVEYIQDAPTYVYGDRDVTEAVVQCMNIYVPAAYFEGDGTVNGYTIDTAPMIYRNSNSAWNTGLPLEGFQFLWQDAYEIEDGVLLEDGCIYVAVGSRGRNTAKSPAEIVDLKAGVRFLRENDDLIPGSCDRLVSVADSGGGEASSLVGATGDMVEFYPYLYELGACGLEWVGPMDYDEATESERLIEENWESEYSDGVYGCMMYCPIADMENADLAYAWMHYDDGVDGMESWGGNYTEFSEYQMMLQDDMAYAFADYINGLELVDADGNPLAFDVYNDDGTYNLRAGSYYESVLAEMSKALNSFIADEEWEEFDSSGYDIPDVYPYADCTSAEEYLMAAYGEYNEGDISDWDWLVQNDDGTYSITDMANFIHGTNLVRNKNIPGFDPLDESAENNAFGGDDNVYEYDEETNTITVVSTSYHHFSQRVADLIQENMEEYDYENEDYSSYEEWLYWLWMDNDGHAYIDEFGDEEYAGMLKQQTWYYNATAMLQDYEQAKAEGYLDEMPTKEGPNIATYWRSRNGTYDQHTSFTIAYNIGLTVTQFMNTYGIDGNYDYALVWGMNHGWTEGNSTGTFADWVMSICQ